MIRNTITITVHKNKFDFNFGMGFLGETLSRLDVDIEGLMNGVSKNPFKFIPIIMYESAKYGFTRKGEEFTHTLYDFMDYIDADGGIQAKSVLKFLEAFTNSMIKDVPKEESTGKKIKAPKKK